MIDGDISDMRFLDEKFFTDRDNATGELIQKGAVTPESIKETAKELLAGRGLVVGLRMNGTKNKENFKTLRSIEAAEDMYFGELTGGFVQYADWAGMNDSGRDYSPNLNQTMNDQFVAAMVLLSEARRKIQSSLSGVVGFNTSSFSAFAERGPMLSEFVRSEYDITPQMVRDMALTLADNLVRADNILWSKSKYPPKRARWTSEFVKFIKQKIG